MAVTGDETETGSAGGMTSWQQPNSSSSSLPQGVTQVNAHSSQRPVEEAIQKRELRLLKNREAARECRRKKKEYVKCLENRVAVLEHQNKALIEELRALKDIYQVKVELASMNEGINGSPEDFQHLTGDGESDAEGPAAEAE